MSQPKTGAATITTNASGAATATLRDSDGLNFSGAVRALIYNKTDFADGVVFLITSGVTGQTLWSQTGVNASATICPMQPTHSTAGAASLYAGSGEPVESPIFLANEPIEITIASGGNTKTGEIRVVVA